MSDVAWIALIIVVYLAFIKPMMQGVMQTPQKDGGKGKAESRKSGGKESDGSRDGDYVDYEEIR